MYRNRREANEQRAMENENLMRRYQANARRRAKAALARLPHVVIESVYKPTYHEVRHGPFPTRRAAQEYATVVLGIAWHRQVIERVEG